MEAIPISMRGTFLVLAIGIVFALPAFSFAESSLVPCSGVAETIGTMPYPVCQICHAVELGQRIINFLVIIASSIAVAIFAWAGFLMMTAAGNEGQVTKAKGMFWNVLLGLVITLAGWLVIDTVMKWAFQGNKEGEGSELYKAMKDNFGFWNEIKCVELPPNKPPSDAPATGTGSQTGTPVSQTSAPNNAPLQMADCNPQNIQAAAQQGGYSLTEAQARTFSCLSIPESRCRNNPGIPRTPDGKETSARGVFQVVLGLSDDCHSLNLPVCTAAAQAAGYNISGNLNCSTAYRGGSMRPDRQELGRACEAAASNFTCNASAAACLLKQNKGSFSAWTADSRSSAQARCIRTLNI
ncbi:hypothetical protein HY416_00975 [Candidatus Kaiserbacteria bacterium]|nr:hypothetical protein [Candidatus Kaiserbacteria bacterium]